MTTDTDNPRLAVQVTVSSTFEDLVDHRAALIECIKKCGMTDLAMENDSAKLSDVIDSSLRMVRDGSAYVIIIGKKYGSTAQSSNRNPEGLSVTELEFNEAQRLGRPTLLFLMGKDYELREEHIETDSGNREKLKRFIERAKQFQADAPVQRVYATFNSLSEFREVIWAPMMELRRYLDGQAVYKDDPVPKPPAFFAVPSYVGSHKFIGRTSQLQDLSDWALPADPNTVLLFEAIGGNGKSMLTWEWTSREATKIRSDWAGRFWYSFYEESARIADFCCRALAYMTGAALGDLRKKRTPELSAELFLELRSRPWLVVLDGLERVLVAYHRIDAAEVQDEEVNRPTDKIANRNPCSAILDEDDRVLRSLAGAIPSKILISSRLTPLTLLNNANQTIPGVRRISLPGLRPPDAEALLRSCDVKGNSEAIQRYLMANCDCHPLVIGVLAGLINNYLPDKGNFDAWVADFDGGAELDLARLDLIQRRNHILRAAIADLPQKSLQLLSTLALLSESVDYQTLLALNPHLPPEPDEVAKPVSPEESSQWDEISANRKTVLRMQYEANLGRWRQYAVATEARLRSPEFRAAKAELTKTVHDLELRGLLKYDGRSKRFDLHPVVRSVAASTLQKEERERFGQRVLDHFSRQAHNPYDEAENLEDVRIGLNLVRTLLKINRFKEASDAFRGKLSSALLFNLEAYAEILSLLRPYFGQGWGELPNVVDTHVGLSLGNIAALALGSCGELKESLDAYGAVLSAGLKTENWIGMGTILHNVSLNLLDQNLLVKTGRIDSYALDLAMLRDDQEAIFKSRLFCFDDYSGLGKWDDAEKTWQLLNPMGRAWSRTAYRPGEAEKSYARFQFRKGTLREEHLAAAETLANEGKSRFIIRGLHRLRGSWRLDQGEWALASASLQEAVRMSRAQGIHDAEPEAGLALAKFHMSQLANPRVEAERLSHARTLSPRLLAMLWLALGEKEQASKYAVSAYKWAWADGEPYVHRHELIKTATLLDELGVSIPNLPPYDPAEDMKLPWEEAIVEEIQRRRQEKERGSTDS